MKIMYKAPYRSWDSPKPTGYLVKGISHLKLVDYMDCTTLPTFILFLIRIYTYMYVCMYI